MLITGSLEWTICFQIVERKRFHVNATCRRQGDEDDHLGIYVKDCIWCQWVSGQLMDAMESLYRPSTSATSCQLQPKGSIRSLKSIITNPSFLIYYQHCSIEICGQQNSGCKFSPPPLLVLLIHWLPYFSRLFPLY